MSEAISPMLVDESAFVASALKRGLRHTQYAEKTNWEAYAAINPLVNDLLTKAEVLVARRSHRALGFVVFQDVEGIALVHIYVRSPERKKGVAKRLFAAALEIISPESTLESYFPTDRWTSLCESYGVFVPEEMP